MCFLTRTSSNIHTQHTTSLRFSKKPARSRLSLLSYPVVSFISLLLLRCLRLLRLRLLRLRLLRCLRLLGSGLLRSLLRLLRRGLLLSVVRLSWVFLVVSISVFVFICVVATSQQPCLKISTHRLRLLRLRRLLERLSELEGSLDLYLLLVWLVIVRHRNKNSSTKPCVQKRASVRWLSYLDELAAGDH